MTGTLRVAPGGANDDPLDVGPKNVKAMVALMGILAKERNLNEDELVRELWVGLPPGWTPERVQQEFMPLRVYNVVQSNFARVLGDPAQLEAYGKLGVKVNFGGLTALVDWVSMLIRFFTSPEWVFRVIIPRVTIGFNDNKRVTAVESSWKHVIHRVIYRDRTGHRTREPDDDVESLVWWAPGFTAAAAWFWGLEAHIFHHLLELDLPKFLLRYLPHGTMLNKGGDGSLYLEGRVVAERVRLYRDTAGFFTADRPEAGNQMYKEGWHVLTDVPCTASDGHTWILAKAGQVFCREAGCSLTEYNWLPPEWFRLVFRLFSYVTRLGPLQAKVAAHMDSRVAESEWQAQVELTRAKLEAAQRERLQADADNYPTPKLAELAVSGRLGERHTPGVILVFDVANFTQLTKSLGSVEAVRRLRPFWEECWRSIKRYSPWTLSWKRGEPVAWVANQPGDGWVLVLSSDFDGDTSLDPEDAKRELVKLALELARRFHEAISEIKDADDNAMRIRVGITWESGLVLFQGGHNNRRVEVAANGVNQAARIQEAGKLPGLADPGGRTTLLEAQLAQVLNHPERFEAAGMPHLKGLGVVALVRCRHDVEELLD